MAKSMKNTERALAKLTEVRAALVEAALEGGAFTKQDICRVTGIKIHELYKLFDSNKALSAKFQVMRKNMADIAADNLQAIISDPLHPQHFQASKYILQNYKSDLDEVLTPQTGDLDILVPGSSLGEESGPVMIRFSSSKKD